MLTIRLMRTGSKKRPSYRVVVKEKLSKRDGAFLENLGFYNPTRNPAEVRLDVERVQYWVSKGAQPSDTVRQIIKRYPSSSSSGGAAQPDNQAEAVPAATTTPAA